MSPREEFFAGVRAEVPLLFGAVPFGLIYGFLAREAGVPPAAAAAMSSIVFAGSAQFIGTQLFSAGAPGLLILLTTFVVNLRHLLYSASVAPYLRPLRPAWKWLLAYLLTDEAYAVTITRLRLGVGAQGHDNAHWFFLGAGLALWISWQVSSVLGVVLGARIPSGWDLEFALPLIFIAITVPMLTDRAARTAAAVAGVIAVLAWAAPMRLGLMAGALAGIAAGVLAERR
ncbi:MAG: AzlC family ABC transporter permease [bacterium]